MIIRFIKITPIIPIFIIWGVVNIIRFASEKSQGICDIITSRYIKWLKIKR